MTAAARRRSDPKPVYHSVKLEPAAYQALVRAQGQLAITLGSRPSMTDVVLNLVSRADWRKR